MHEGVLEWAGKSGYLVAWGAVEAVEGATAEVEERNRRGELDRALYASEIASLVAGRDWARTDTLVMVATPRPAHRVHFELEDQSFAALLPPTYVRYRATFEEVRLDLQRNALPGWRVDHLTGPLKATAARLGLVRYGLNNLGYVRGLGSYIQLCAYLTDAPLPDGESGTLREPALLDECAGCGACAGVCPTGAIADERVLISAHRCLTFANEVPGDWPQWAPDWAHTCLLGCLECQKVCPVNPELRVEDTGVAFSAAEKRALLADGDGAGGRTENGVRAKLAWLGQPSAEPVLGRNLRALLAASARGSLAPT